MEQQVQQEIKKYQEGDLILNILDHKSGWYAYSYSGAAVYHQVAAGWTPDQLNVLDTHLYTILTALRSLSSRARRILTSYANNCSRPVQIVVNTTNEYITRSLKDLMCDSEEVRERVNPVVFNRLTAICKELDAVLLGNTVTPEFPSIKKTFTWAIKAMTWEKEDELLLKRMRVASVDRRHDYNANNNNDVTQVVSA